MIKTKADDIMPDSFIKNRDSSITINMTFILPIATLMLDGFIRYEYDQASTLEYIMNLLSNVGN